MADTPRGRSALDAAASQQLGVAATRHGERAMASLGLLAEAPTYFRAHESVHCAGVLFSLPALESQGLYTFLETYGSLGKGYYGLSHVVLLLSMMALCRIKNPEQLKNHAPGELGKLLGLDRSPESKCLRGKLFSGNVTMRICERETVLSQVIFREVRRLSDNGHQTAIITTNRIIDTAQVAAKMFSRWNQENYFRYMIQEFDLDRIIEYGSEPENPNKTVVNPPYRKISSQLKKAREKKARLQAKMFAAIEEHLDSDLETVAACLGEQAAINEKIQEYDKLITGLGGQRNNIPSRVAVGQMPEEKRYNRQKKESKLLINIIKMMAYRAETAMANLVRPHYANSDKDGRTLLKEIFTSPADIFPDYENKTLTVVLHSMSNPRRNRAVAELCTTLNETQTIYPQTELRIIFKSIAI